jgi:thioredoxin reductase (NADPH)
MGKPAILIVDDEIQVLNAVDRDLKAHFRSEYRIVKASTGQEALLTVNELQRRSITIALFLVDQRMPGMSGTEFLREAMLIYPEAKKVLLTAYADTTAAIESINQVGLDFYLMKPWDPPEEHLYPVLDDLLSDWRANALVPFEGIQVVGTLWSATCHSVKDFLARNQVPYKWLDIEKDPMANRMIAEVQKGSLELPVVFFPDGTWMSQPSIRDLAEKIGLHTRAVKPFYDLAIIGAGPAGLAAAVYGASEGLHTVMIEREAPGGQAGTSSRIENYLGFPNGLSGSDLARRAVTQARRFGVEIVSAEEVQGIRVEDSYRYIHLSGESELSCHALLIASGVSVRRLVAPGIEELTGSGVYYGAALTEAAFYRDQDVFVIGGANSAGQAAVFFSRFARKVTMIIRGSNLAAGMSQYLVDQISQIPSIQVLFNAEVAEARGKGRLEELCIQFKNTGELVTFPAAAMFIFIGALPRTDMIKGIVECDTAGFILTGPDLFRQGKWPASWMEKRDPYLLETSCPGVFAAGDVRHGSIKRVASAVGEGAVAVALVHQYLSMV